MSPLVPVNPPHGTNGHNGHGHNGNGHNGNGQSNGVFVPVVSRPQIQRLTDSRCDPDVLDGRTQIFILFLATVAFIFQGTTYFVRLSIVRPSFVSLSNHITIGIWNLCLGLPNKKDIVTGILDLNKVDICCLQETEIPNGFPEKIKFS